MDPIVVPAILDEALFEAAKRISGDNARRAEPRHWLLRGLGQAWTLRRGRVVPQDARAAMAPSIVLLLP